MSEETKDLVVSETQTGVDKLIENKVNQTTDVNTALDLMFTHEALKDKDTLDSALQEKKEEIRNDAEARRIQAEAERIAREAEKIKQEKEKQLAELDKVISAKQKEIEQLKADSDKAQAFFESNEDILSYIGVRTKKTLKVMYMLMIPAIVIFMIVQIIALPVTIVGKLVEIVINIISGICKVISNNALKMFIAILVVILILGCGLAIYYFGGKLIF